jgi:hypothetical protein
VNRESRVERWAAWAGYAWLAVVGACVVAASWTGLVGFAEDILGLDDRARYIVPISLDGLAITLAFFGLRAVLAGDAAVLPRTLAWIVVGSGAGFNYWHAKHTGQGEAAAIYFGGMTAFVYLTFEVVLRQLRRRNLREAGAVERPLPRFRLARWLRFPRLTFRAWSAAVRFGLTDPADALRRVQVEHVHLRAPDLDQGEERSELEVRETVTRSVTARNGTKAARIAELAGQGLDLDAIVEATGFARDTVRVTLSRIEQRSGS